MVRCWLLIIVCSLGLVGFVGALSNLLVGCVSWCIAGFAVDLLVVVW